MDRIKIFVSYDPKSDSDLLDIMRAQSERSGSVFSIAGQSDPSEMTEARSDKLREELAATDEVVVICGESTKDSERVATELCIAQEENKPYLLIWGRRSVMCTKPSSATKLDAMYGWAPETFGDQVGDTLRQWKAKEDAAAAPPGSRDAQR